MVPIFSAPYLKQDISSILKTLNLTILKVSKERERERKNFWLFANIINVSQMPNHNTLFVVVERWYVVYVNFWKTKRISDNINPIMSKSEKG